MGIQPAGAGHACEEKRAGQSDAQPDRDKQQRLLKTRSASRRAASGAIPRATFCSTSMSM
jgi:hypothetical protein